MHGVANGQAADFIYWELCFVVKIVRDDNAGKKKMRREVMAIVEGGANNEGVNDSTYIYDREVVTRGQVTSPKSRKVTGKPARGTCNIQLRISKICCP